MTTCNLLIKDNVEFATHHDVLKHLADTLIEQEIVKPSYRQAIIEREASFPTGILLDGYAVAIPHCEADHALKPAIYMLKLDKPVAFYRADEDSTVDVSLILALVVTEPALQLALLRSLFSELQNEQFYHTLLTSSNDDISQLFQQKIFNHR
ncbi:PTS galactitol transporter subunit IIA [Utexia brackfieldae]|uniref:PTS galactitol transporter subunit IIA n=1 Tax=Utexia brackfieldae TaxID=3074108 RepID=UPI00370D1CFB